MRVVDAYGNEHAFEDWHTQDFELQFAWLRPWGNTRMNWRTEAGKKAKQKHAALMQLRCLGVPPEPPCTIVLQRIARGRGLDDDNVPDCMKYIRDTIAIDWMGLPNDKVEGLKFLYGQLGTNRKGFLGVRVTIYNEVLTAVP